MEQTINQQAMDFTRLVEHFMRGGEEGAMQVNESDIADAMYALRAAIERDEQRQLALA